MNGNGNDRDFSVMKFRFMAKLSSWTMFGFFLYIFSITFGIVPDPNLPSVNTILGFLILEIGIMIGYYFGASQSSSAQAARDKTEPPGTVTHEETETHKTTVSDKPPTDKPEVKGPQG